MPGLATTVDAPARRLASTLLRRLASGRITNDAFEAQWPSSPDPALRVLRDAAWFLYSDTHEYRLAGPDRLLPSVKRHLARWILFLHTELPYAWPEMSRPESLARLFAGLITLGVATRLWKTALERSDDADVWPFFRRTDFRRALRSPRLLTRADQTLPRPRDRDRSGVV